MTRQHVPTERRSAELHARVRDHLTAGESPVAAVRVCRAWGRPSASEIAEAELAPGALLSTAAAEAAGIDPGATGPERYRDSRRGALHGAAGSDAAALDEAVPGSPGLRVLVRTGKRVFLLSEAPGGAPGLIAGVLKGVIHMVRLPAPAFEPVPPLVLRWERAAGRVAGVSYRDGGLRLSFSDGSRLRLLCDRAAGARFAEN